MADALTCTFVVWFHIGWSRTVITIITLLYSTPKHATHLESYPTMYHVSNVCTICRTVNAVDTLSRSRCPSVKDIESYPDHKKMRGTVYAV